MILRCANRTIRVVLLPFMVLSAVVVTGLGVLGTLPVPETTSAYPGAERTGGARICGDEELRDAIGPAVDPTVIHAPVTLLMDYETGTVLHAQKAHVPRVPASLTKLVTIYTAMEASRDGSFALDRPQPVDPRAYASAMAPGSSLMFLGSDQVVDGWDLLRGLAVASGNDAALEVALRVAGSESAFAGAMNRTVRSLGLTGMYFEEPSGLSPGNRITAAEFAEFTRAFIATWPETLNELFTLPSFAYPQARHYEDGVLHGGTILQYNRNTLLESYSGADGLKTGYTSAAGYNLVATAERDGRRLIVVVLGVDAAGHQQGGRRRSQDAASLLDWGFDRFERIVPVVPDPGKLRVRGGDSHRVDLRVDDPPVLVLSRESEESLRGEIHLKEEIWAPWSDREPVGVVRYHRNGCVLAEIPVYPVRTVERGGVIPRGWDRLRWWLSSFLPIGDG